MTSSNRDIREQLINQGFLALTLKYPISLKPLKFHLADNTLCTLLDSGVLMIEPKFTVVIKSYSDIVLSSGIHGNETAPIEILDRIVRDIINGGISVKNRILFIIGNPFAAIKQKRFINLNLNRLFSYEKNDEFSIEGNRANLLMQHVDTFFNGDFKMQTNRRIHYDLHTAIRASLYPQFVIYPYQDDEDFDYISLSLFKRSGIKTILLSHQPNSTFSYFTSHNYKAEAFTVELGSVRSFGENNLEDFKAVHAELIDLISNNCQKDDEFDSADDYRVFRVKHELIKKSDDFKLNIDSDVHNFHQFKAGITITNDIDGGYVTDENDAIVFPNANVPIDQRAGLIITQETQ